MTTYVVEWSIELDAESPRDAAEQARGIQQDPHSTAVVFFVRAGPRARRFKVDLQERTDT